MAKGIKSEKESKDKKHHITLGKQDEEEKIN